MPRPELASLAVTALLAAACYAPKIALERSYHPSDADLTVTRIIHGSLILDFRGTRILVDPWYSPSPPVGPTAEIGLSLGKLPPLRGILLTHEHDDHFDLETLGTYPDRDVRVVLPRELGETVRRLGYRDVVEVATWEQTQIGSVLVYSVPARHSVAENGYVLQANGITTYVAGDTRFDPKIFWAIAEAFPTIDVALFPVGGIRLLGRKLDMNADEAARAYGILKPSRVIPVHYEMVGPFPLVIADEDAAAEFVQAIERRFPGSGSAVVRLETGESWHHYR